MLKIFNLLINVNILKLMNFMLINSSIIIILNFYKMFDFFSTRRILILLYIVLIFIHKYSLFKCYIYIHKDYPIYFLYFIVILFHILIVVFIDPLIIF